MPQGPGWSTEHVFDPRYPEAYKNHLIWLDDHRYQIPTGTQMVIENGWVFTKLDYGNFWELIEGEEQVGGIKRGIPLTHYQFLPALANFGGRLEFRAAECRQKAHFGSRADAALARVFEVGPVAVPGGFLRRRRILDPHVAHLASAEERIAELADSLSARESRQHGDTLFHQLRAEGFAEDGVGRPFAQELAPGHVAVRAVALAGQAAPVVGLKYETTGDRNVARALAFIADGLRKGEYESGDVLFYEKDGRHVFAVKGRDTQLFGSGIEFDPGVLAAAAAMERFTGAAIAEVEDHQALAVVTTDPMEASLLEKLKSAHDGGHLRMGDPADPFAGCAFFYDDRDLNRANKSDHIRAETAHRHALVFIAPTDQRLRAMNGHVLELSPQVDAHVKDVRDVHYRLEWEISGRRPISGLFHKDDLDRLADRDFTVLPR